MSRKRIYFDGQAKAFVVCSLLFALYGLPADAYEYNRERIGMRLNGFGTIGPLVSRDESGYIVGDFRLRGQANYAVKRGWTTGGVVSTDRLSVDTKHYVRDLFVFVESPWGRVELGQTDSIATKLGVGLPDVGGLRINDYPILFDAIKPDGPAITFPTVIGTHYALRANVVSVPTKPLQFGASASPWSHSYRYATDAGLKFRMPHGKTKIALSAGAMFIDTPDGMTGDIYAPRVYADWRAQLSGGLNVQYNSWNFGTFIRGVYDKNPVGVPSDGLAVGTGISYDILQFSISASYIASETGVFHDTKNFLNHAGILSGRYKFNEWFDAWISTGAAFTDKTHPFVSGGIRGTF